MRREVKQLQNLQQQNLNHSVIKYKKDDYKIENSEFIKAKRVKYSVSKELIFNDFDKPTRNITNTLITTTENEL